MKDSKSAGNVARIVMILIVLAFFFVMASQVFDVIEPYLFPLRLIQGNAEQLSERIIIGPYPRREEIARLVKQKNVVEIISLMDPDFPPERTLLIREREDAAAAGVRLTNVGLSPLIPIREARKRDAKRVARYVFDKYYTRKGRGTVYIHCYFGRHRVQDVAKALRKLVHEARENKTEEERE